MIGYIKGTVLEVKDSTCTVLTSSGVGYEVLVPIGTLKEITQGKEVGLYIKTIVKEDAIELYGFHTRQEKDTFELLLGINKLGPKIAMNIVSLFSFKELEELALKDDWRSLTHVPGVGPKLSKRILWELKEKLQTQSILRPNTLNTSYSDVISALKNLGYKEGEIMDALEEVIRTKGITSEKEIIKEALKVLSKRFSV